MIACIFYYFIFIFYLFILFITFYILLVLYFQNLDIIILLKQLLFICHKLISVSLLDWSEVGLLL